MNFFRRERIFKSEIGESPNWIDVIPKTVTLKKTLHPTIFENKTNGDDISPFKEVQTVPFFEAATEETLEFMRTTFERYTIPEKKFAYRLYQAVYDSIKESWGKDKFHVVSVSSGFDTRLIALIISRLRENHGDIGEIAFYEIGEEGGEGKKVLKHLGLDDYPYYYLNEGLPPDEIYEDNLDFSRAWERHGIVGWPVNYWYDPIDRLQREGNVPKEIQCFTGYAANETTRCCQIPQKFIGQVGDALKDFPVGNDFAYYFYWIYYCAINSFPLLGEWVHPWYDFKVLETLYSYSLNQVNVHAVARMGGSVSNVILKHLDPDLYSAAEHLSTKTVEDLGYRRVSRRLMNKAVSDYKGSWYGKIKRVNPNPLMTYNEWWGHWNLASLCEHLLSNGYKIEVEK